MTLSKFKTFLFSDSSTLSLLGSNLLVIVLAVFQDWSLAHVLWIYWFQSVIIGAFHAKRMALLCHFSTKNFTINNQPAAPTPATKRFTVGFFIFHYGFFHFIYAIFLGSLAGEVTFTNVLLGAVPFVFNHYYSFRHNVQSDQKQIRNLGVLMFFPYARIIPMHLIIISGLFMASASTFSLVIFLSLKTIADLVMHTVKHTTQA